MDGTGGGRRTRYTIMLSPYLPALGAGLFRGQGNRKIRRDPGFARMQASVGPALRRRMAPRLGRWCPAGAGCAPCASAGTDGEGRDRCAPGSRPPERPRPGPRCRLFSMPQCALTVANRGRASGGWLAMKWRVSVLTWPSTRRCASPVRRLRGPGQCLTGSPCCRYSGSSKAQPRRLSMRPWAPFRVRWAVWGQPSNSASRAALQVSARAARSRVWCCLTVST